MVAYQDIYSLGYGEEITSIFSNRSAIKQCAYMLPYIQPGMKGLDVGCGPGSITADFADLVLPQGTIVGVDVSEHQLEHARQLAKTRQLENIHFKLATIMKLPFGDQTFDFTHVSGVLCQIADPLAGLKELKRVTKPGGFVAVREPIFECYIIYPDDEVFKESIKIATHAVNALKSDFNLGKKLKSLFYQANVENIVVSATCESQANLAEIKKVCQSLQEDWHSAPWSHYIRKHQLASEAQISQYLQAIQRFANHPEAFLSIPWGQGIGFV